MNGEQIGYLNRQLAAQLAPQFDMVEKPVIGFVTIVTGTPTRGHIRGVVVQFSLPDDLSFRKSTRFAL